MAILVSVVHSAAMIAVGGFSAWLVYRYLGLKFVSRSWFNLDATWAVSLILVGALSLAIIVANEQSRISAGSVKNKRQEPYRASATTGSPKTKCKSRSTFIDPALVLNEGGKRFGTRLVLRCVPQHARPLGSRSQPAQPQRPTRTAPGRCVVGAADRSGRCPA
jgi:hypothetical protein